VTASLICLSFSSSMLGYLVGDHDPPGDVCNLAATLMPNCGNESKPWEA
jgi:hypothetical protein